MRQIVLAAGSTSGSRLLGSDVRLADTVCDRINVVELAIYISEKYPVTAHCMHTNTNIYIHINIVRVIVYRTNHTYKTSFKEEEVKRGLKMTITIIFNKSTHQLKVK